MAVEAATRLRRTQHATVGGVGLRFTVSNAASGQVVGRPLAVRGLSLFRHHLARQCAVAASDAPKRSDPH